MTMDSQPPQFASAFEGIAIKFVPKIDTSGFLTTFLTISPAEVTLFTTNYLHEFDWDVYRQGTQKLVTLCLQLLHFY